MAGVELLPAIIDGDRDVRKRWPHVHAELPADKRLNVLFDQVPGITCCPFTIVEIPVGICLIFYHWSLMTWTLFCYMLLFFTWKECVPMSGCLHRYWSHKSFKVGRVTQFGLYILACLASQAGPLWWASKHRKHHKHCDDELDPHSPVTSSKLYAWIGWLFLFDAEGALGKGVDEEYIQDHLKYPELAYMENFHFVPILVLHYAFYYFGGLPWLIHVSGESIFLANFLRPVRMPPNICPTVPLLQYDFRQPSRRPRPDVAVPWNRFRMRGAAVYIILPCKFLQLSPPPVKFDTCHPPLLRRAISTIVTPCK